MTKRTLIVLVVAAALAPRLAQAGAENAGTTAANFLTVGSGPSALAMGGATLGLTNGLDAASLNVGALGWLDGNAFTLSHASLDDQSKQEWASFGGQLGGFGTRWGASGLYQSEGTFEGRDAGNNPTGTFDVSSMAVGVQLAQAVTDKLSLGLGTKWVSDKLGDATTGSGFTFDAGASMRMGWVGLGFAAQNVFGKMRYDGLSYDFPSNVGIGIGVTHPSGITAALDLNMPSSYYKNVRGGVEWLYRQNVAVRMGYRYDLGASDVDALGGPTFGVGAGANGFWFDYGYLISGNQGGQHRIALSFRPGTTPREETGGWSSTARSLQASPPPQPKSKPKHEPESESISTPPAKPKPSSESVPARKPFSEEASSLPEAPAKTSSPPKASAQGSSTAPKASVSPQGAPMPSAPAPITSPPATPTSTGRHAVEMAKGAAAAPPSAPAAPPPAPTTPPPSTANVAPPKPAAPADAAKSAPAPETKSAPSGSATPPDAKPAPAKVEAPAPQGPAKSAPRPATVMVKKGETLDDIARQWGTSAAAIMMENNLVRDKVKPGQVLKLPRK
jgi:LysM repeat protein